ncbi:lipid IV(A) 3-deoxy-D-manno-octulosonic acid transferase [Methylobacillus flagellatus]|uniref:lipid IV(A) 3-deoxy-D-manno-octulosonic acid transferase n=1 Tax=Methylobacillus flagellatus TaxID=405 RepID=UPI0010F53468|nr:lipid IV(A) 3-deoxy-D-manno-octulosonic acid transferase [Methylobacillus flagellatus]
MPRLLYTLLIYALLPLTPLKLLWRGLRQPEYRQHWAERYGFYSQPDQTPHSSQRPPLIWLHCVSVGETRAAAPLIALLQQRYPQHRILLTHATPTGREAGEQLFGAHVLRCYLPYDTPGAVRRFLNQFRPQFGLIMETELWFNLIAACKAGNIPLLLVNARLSARSARGYSKLPRLTAQGLQSLHAIAAQSEADAARLRGLGAHNVTVTGNLKFDVTPPADAEAQGQALRKRLGTDRPLFLAASTREGEEALILDAIAEANIAQLLTVIVPRHPQRFDEVASLLQARGVRYARRSGLDDALLPRETQVLLGDSMGEMFTYYGACDLTLIGGSLLPYGSQNLIEACAMGKPVLIGPHSYNFAQASAQALECGAAQQVDGLEQLAQALQHLLEHPLQREAMAQAGLKFTQQNRGATERVVAVIVNSLAA